MVFTSQVHVTGVNYWQEQTACSAKFTPEPNTALNIPSAKYRQRLLRSTMIQIRAGLLVAGKLYHKIGNIQVEMSSYYHV
jgi:hypothetical protein